MKKWIRSLNHTLFDVASGPVILLMLGLPVLLIVVVAGLIVLACVLITKAHKRNQQKKRELEKTDS